MSRALHDDVGRWQAGLLSADELHARHPGPEVASALAAHRALQTLAAAPVPDAAPVWSQLAATLPARPASPPPRRFRRPVVVAVVAAVLAGPAVSYAAAPDAVRSGLRQVAELFTNRDDDVERRPAHPVSVDEPEGTTEEPAGDDRDVDARDPSPSTLRPDGSARANGDDPDDRPVVAPSDDPDEPAGDTSGTPDDDQPEEPDPADTDTDVPDSNDEPGDPDAPDAPDAPVVDLDRTEDAEGAEDPDASLDDVRAAAEPDDG